MLTVVPAYCSVTGGRVRLTYCILDPFVLIVLLLSEITVRKVTINIMPAFTPTDQMLEMHADKGKEDWEIYAWCVRDAIARQGGFEKKENNPYNERNAYFDYVNGRCSC